MHKIIFNIYLIFLCNQNLIFGCSDETCALWQVSDWSPCSSLCGPGVNLRLGFSSTNMFIIRNLYIKQGFSTLFFNCIIFIV